MSNHDDCFDELIELTKRFIANEEEAFNRLMNFAAGDTPPMNEHGNYIDDSAELVRQRINDGQDLLLCITKCFDFEKENGYGTDLCDALNALERAVSSLNEWTPLIDLRFYGSEDEFCSKGIGWSDGKAKLNASIELVDQSLVKVLRLRMLARQKACAASMGETIPRASDCPSPRTEEKFPSPKVYLNSWSQITDALSTETDKVEIAKVRAAHVNFQGPIVMPTQGGQPKVVKAELLAWWNGLEDLYRKEAAERGSHLVDRSATVENQFDRGRGEHEETIVPEIAGRVKRRRGST